MSLGNLRIQREHVWENKNIMRAKYIYIYIYLWTTDLSTACCQCRRGAVTHFRRPRRNALNLCLLCRSWGSSPTQSCRLNNTWVLGPLKVDWEEEEKIYRERESERGINRETNIGLRKLTVQLGIHKPIDSCILLFSILDIKINKYRLMCGKGREKPIAYNYQPGGKKQPISNP